MRRTLLALSSLALFLLPADLLAQKKDPLTSFQFGLKLNVVGIGQTTAFFKSVSGLGSETDVVEFREGGANGTITKLPGVTKWSNIVLKRGFTNDNTLLTWRNQVIQGVIEQARQNPTLILLDKSNTPVAQWTLTRAWPSGLHVEVDPETGELNEVLEIAVDISTRQ